MHVPQFLGCGKTPRFNYVVMQMVGANLSELRKQQPRQRFTAAVTAALGVQVQHEYQAVRRSRAQMIEAIRAVHERGVLHRDIKPSNFAIGAQLHVACRLRSDRAAAPR